MEIERVDGGILQERRDTFGGPTNCDQDSMGLEVLDLSYPVYMVWGPTTDIGKTVVSAGLIGAALARTAAGSNGRHVVYIKPVQTGFPADSDSRFVHASVAEMMHQRGLLAAVPATQTAVPVCSSAAMLVEHSSWQMAHEAEGMATKRTCATDASKTTESSYLNDSDKHRSLECLTMWTWKNPVSPHLAVDLEGGAVCDKTVDEGLRRVLLSSGRRRRPPKHLNSQEMGEYGYGGGCFSLVETAGGVASPGPSGTLQCDLYRRLRLPVLLVGDGRLGGISTTISAYESLRLRGYDIDVVVVIDTGLGNGEALRRHLPSDVAVAMLPPLPARSSSGLDGWFADTEGKFVSLFANLEEAFHRRRKQRDGLASTARKILWWPFTQHGTTMLADVTTIDSRCGENFAVFEKKPAVCLGDGKMGGECGDEPAGVDMIVEQFDACASWWTQGLGLPLQLEMAQAVGSAAGRYGHVIFPEVANELSVKCATMLLERLGKGWASRVFFSDNGSTAIEVALKMAFRTYAIRHGLHLSSEWGGPRDSSSASSPPEFQILGLMGSYHGDTLGAMEAQAPSAFNGFLQQPWYKGRGLFLEPPKVEYKDGRWGVRIPPSGYRSEGDVGQVEGVDRTRCWLCKEEVFALDRDMSPLATMYEEFVEGTLNQVERTTEGRTVAALMIETVVHGAGGMEMIDPLFQRVLVKKCQKRKIPVIFDEVFAGCWRLGRESARELLGCDPDIACFAKLMTGGVVPMAATIATEEVFDAFKGGSKLDALLHGHSYSAHPIGCSAAIKALESFSDAGKNPNYLSIKHCLRELWDPALVRQASFLKNIRRVVSIGTLFAAEISTDGFAAGYASGASKAIVSQLRNQGIFTRPLGNVVYVMVTPTTSPTRCSWLLETLIDVCSKDE